MGEAMAVEGAGGEEAGSEGGDWGEGVGSVGEGLVEGESRWERCLHSCCL